MLKKTLLTLLSICTAPSIAMALSVSDVEKALSHPSLQSRVQSVSVITYEIIPVEGGTRMTSFPGAKPKESCHIQIEANHESYVPSFIDDKEKDLLFLLSHEITHCETGVQIFTEDVWQIDIDNKKTLSDLFRASPFATIIYHEMLSDIFSLFLLYQQQNLNAQDVESVLSTRESDCTAITSNNYCQGYNTHAVRSQILSVLSDPDFSSYNAITLRNKAHIIVQLYLLRNAQDILQVRDSHEE